MSGFSCPAGIPARAGAGFKLAHANAILDAPDQLGFVEIHAENFMGDGGVPHRLLTAVRERLPVSLHGVGLSIGAEGPLDKAHLARLGAVAARYEPGLVSEHLAWSTHDGAYYNDLLPLPYTAGTLARVVSHINEVQDTLGRTMLLENPSSYLAFDSSTMDELSFMKAVTRQTGCGLILDVNNVFISAANLGFTAHDYIAAFPVEAVGEIHLAGHAEDADATGAPLLIDTHDRPVAPPVWSLYRAVLERTGRPVPTLIEWDTDIPPFEILAAEVSRADRILQACAATEGVG
ncbi:DUF692 domain-containing protein [Acuticoccus sp. MNP-M23]|uniref:MNIO family bufferin maturase n=1 Tax=Acuticoccus sp. MNP-M23 TaxID=3072793 RepID=UPI0028167FF0|nr:DUF692 domain-containing protein [Acuticoccus sp. MNP-M23]WMS41302.1 DUF692 domain-containing protein [Acuticoccus sp. MNP-M23]